jgi:hypothetical protein
MSQNKSATELDGVVQGLARDGADDILAIMKP